MEKPFSCAFATSLAVGLFGCLFLFVNGNVVERKYDEEAGRIYLRKINADIQVKTTESVLASWAYESNITDENLKNQLDVSAKLANFTKEIWKETVKYPWKTFKDPDVRRQFQKFSVLGTAILSPKKYEKLNKIISEMQSTYGKARICNYHNRTDCSMQLEPELTEIFVKSRDPNELRYYWEQWRKAAGKPARKLYKEYVDLSNEAAVLNNFTDNTEFWLRDYEAKDFKQQVEALWLQLRPLYLQLHAYVRRRLREQYGETHVTKRGPIPAHLLGNMWAQSWGNIFDFTVPYPGKPSLDVTPNMVEQGYTPLRMFKLADEFFTSLNLSPMPDTFWRNSILEKPNDGRDLICHASAWDFYDGEDFRIKQCTRITMEDLNTVHHEMGHIQYFLQYKNQPLVYKEGTNPGFHEAVGDVMALSVSTPKHLRKIGLLNATQDDAESDINQLFSMALDKIAFLPFGYLMDQWRWSVFEGKTTEKDYNCKWWQLREKYQGLSPSVTRSESDFDPGAKYHTVGNVPYIRYFVSFVIQFQFHRSLCVAAKEYDPNDPASKPLHKCDIYQSKEAGALLKKMLQMGSSKPWPDAMEVMTGQRKMDARPLLEYFATLQTWLEKENKKTGEYIGWESSQKVCEDSEESENEAPSTGADGVLEDDSIGYSYAELVRQDDNAFGVPDYFEEIYPSFLALANKENDIQTGYPTSVKTAFNVPDPPLKYASSRNTYDRISSNINNQPVRIPENSAGDLSNNELIDSILLKLHQIKSDEPEDSKSMKNRETEIDSNERQTFGAKPRVKETRKVKFKPKYKAKYNSCKDLKLNSPEEGTDNEGKPDCSSEQAKPETATNFPSPSLELMWKAELAKVEAEQMLKNFNFSAYDELISNLSDFPSLQDQDHGPKTNPIISTLGTNPNTKSAPSGFRESEPRFEKCSLLDAAPPRFTPYKPENTRNNKRNSERKNVFLMLIGQLMDGPKDEKQYVKKSFKEYHYKIRPPVIYNSVIITAGGKNDKPEEVKDRSSINSNKSVPTRKRQATREKRRAGAFLRGQEGHRRKLKHRLFKTVKGRKVNIRKVLD